jgi:hypothetical protein
MTPDHDCRGVLLELLRLTEDFLRSEAGSRLASVGANNYALDIKSDVEYALAQLGETSEKGDPK